MTARKECEATSKCKQSVFCMNHTVTDQPGISLALHWFQKGAPPG